MRIIAGQWKGRRLSAPKGKVTRPTPDRVREALFSILGDRLQEASVLVLFAGTGCLGLEALSRGAQHAFFVEKDRRVFDILQQNLEIADSTRVSSMNSPAQRALRVLKKQEQYFDLAFLDPPYDRGLLEPTFHHLLELGLVRTSGTVVCEHHSKTDPPTPIEQWSLKSTRLFGDMGISLFECGDGE